jgi:hypothetical protein
LDKCKREKGKGNTWSKYGEGKEQRIIEPNKISEERRQ